MALGRDIIKLFVAVRLRLYSRQLHNIIKISTEYCCYAFSR